MSEQNTQEEKEASSSEVVELTWQEVEPIVTTRAQLKQYENELAAMLLAYEKRKLIFLDRISNLEDEVIVNARNLRDSKGISPESTYELKLPMSEGEKGYFIRKEQ